MFLPLNRGFVQSKALLTRISRFSKVVTTSSPDSFRRAPIPPLVPPDASKGVPIPIRAYYVSRGIDLSRITMSHQYKSSSRLHQSRSLTLTLNEEQNQYISVFQYGSIVFFNVPEDSHQAHMATIMAQAGPSAASLSPEKHPTENYKIIIHDKLDKPSVIKAEHLNIRTLDLNNITIVGTVMAETVALDYYASTVDTMLNKFVDMNLKIQSTGNFKNLSSSELHKMIASNNIVITNVLSKMGLFEGTDAAWENATYYYTWEALRKDFEIESRFKDISQKLDIVKADAQFFLEVLHNQKSTKLEWIIIALIAGEMVIGICGLGLQLSGYSVAH